MERGGGWHVLTYPARPRFALLQRRMTMLRIRSMVLTVLMTMPLLATAEPAPTAAPGGAIGGGSHSGGGVVDPGRFKVQTLEAIHEKLGASDDDWNKLRPKIEKVLEAQRSARTGAGL